jgi:hypothetical protein
MLINEAPSVSVIKAAKNYWEIIFTVFAGATIIMSWTGLGIIASFSVGLAVGATLGVWVAIRKYEANFLSRIDAHAENKMEK